MTCRALNHVKESYNLTTLLPQNVNNSVEKQSSELITRIESRKCCERLRNAASITKSKTHKFYGEIDKKSIGIGRIVNKLVTLFDKRGVNCSTGP